MVPEFYHFPDPGMLSPMLGSFGVMTGFMVWHISSLVVKSVATKHVEKQLVGVSLAFIILPITFGVTCFAWNHGFFQDDYKGAAYAILREDGIPAADREKMVGTLTDSIGRCCATYRCNPSEVTAAARKLRDSMRRSMPDTTLTSAANTLTAGGGTTLSEATENMIQAFSKP